MLYVMETFFSRLRRCFRREPIPPVSEWFSVSWTDDEVALDVRPPGQKPWTAKFRWKDIIRICFKAEDLGVSDGIYVFTSTRPESFVIPTEAKGGSEFWGQIIDRRLFDAELAIKAASAAEGLFFWPPIEAEQ